MECSTVTTISPSFFLWFSFRCYRNSFPCKNSIRYETIENQCNQSNLNIKGKSIKVPYVSVYLKFLEVTQSI